MAKVANIVIFFIPLIVLSSFLHIFSPAMLTCDMYQWIVSFLVSSDSTLLPPLFFLYLLYLSVCGD